MPLSSPPAPADNSVGTAPRPRPRPRPAVREQGNQRPGQCGRRRRQGDLVRGNLGRDGGAVGGFRRPHRRRSRLRPSPQCHRGGLCVSTGAVATGLGAYAFVCETPGRCLVLGWSRAFGTVPPLLVGRLSGGLEVAPTRASFAGGGVGR